MLMWHDWSTHGCRDGRWRCRVRNNEPARQSPDAAFATWRRCRNKSAACRGLSGRGSGNLFAMKPNQLFLKYSSKNFVGFTTQKNNQSRALATPSLIHCLPSKRVRSSAKSKPHMACPWHQFLYRGEKLQSKLRSKCPLREQKSIGSATCEVRPINLPPANRWRESIAPCA